MVKIKLFALLSCALLFSCDDLNSNSNALETMKNDMLLRSGVLCELKPDPGPCRAWISKYYFDQKTQKCKEFGWGGCNGTVPFETLNECMNACQ